MFQMILFMKVYHTVPNLEPNQVHSWYNLKGELYLKPLNNDIDKIFLKKALKTLQIKTEHIQFNRPTNNIPMCYLQIHQLNTPYFLYLKRYY